MNKNKERRIRESDRRTSSTRKKRRRRSRGRSGCSNCLITLVVLFVIFVGILYGGGTIAWNMYAKPVVGISLNDALGIAFGLYSADEDKIITNGYGETDLNNFYSNLSSALYLSSDTDLKANLSKVLDDYASKALDSNDETSESGTEIASTAVEVPSETSSTEETSITGNETLDGFLENMNFDFSRLKDYEDEYSTPQVLELNDKQVAAFLDDTIKIALKSEAVSTKLPSEVSKYNIDLSSMVAVPQVTVSNKKVLDLDEVSITLTVQINLKDAAKSALSSINKSLGFLSFVVPSKIYGTITIYPNNYLKPAEIMINDYSQEKMNKAYTAADAILKDTEYGSVEGILKTVNQKAIEAIEKVEDIVPINFIDSGSVEIRPIEAMMKVMNITNITQTQFFCMIRDVCLPEFKDIAEDLGFEEGTEYDDVQIKLNEGMDDFIVELENKYAVEHGYITTNNVFDTLTNVSSEESTLMDHIAISNLNFEDSTYVSSNHKLDLTYFGLAGMLNSYLKNQEETTPAEESSSSVDIDYKIINMYVDASTNTLSIVLEVGLLSALSGTIDETSVEYSLISQLIPANIYLTANIALLDGTTQLRLNGKTIEQTQEHLNTITSMCSSLGMDISDLNYTKLTSDVGTKVTDGIADIETKLGTDILFMEDAAFLPNLYEVMANVVFYTEGSEDNVTPSELYLTLHDLEEEMPGSFETAAGAMGLGINTTETAYEEIKGTNLSTFITSFTSQYAINNADNYINNSNVYNRLTNIGDDSTIINRVEVANLQFSEGAYDAEDYKVETGYLALAKILDDYMDNETTAGEGQISSSDYSLLNVSYKETVDPETAATLRGLTLMVRVSLQNIVSLDEESSTYEIAKSILPTDIYLLATVYLDKVDEQIVTDIKVAGLEDGDSTQAFLNRIKKVGTALGTDLSSFDYDSLKSTLGENVFNGLSMLKDKLGTEVSFNTTAAFLPSLYEIMAGKILFSSVEGDPNLSDEEVYCVFKDLHAVPEEYSVSNKANSNANLVSEINNKYFINEGYQIEEPVSDEDITIVNQMTALASNYDAAIDGAALAQQWDTATISAITTAAKEAIMLTQFSPAASEGETAKLFADAVKITSDGLKDIMIDSVYVVNSTTIKMIFTCTYDQTTGEGETSYAGVIPDFVINLSLDISKIDSEERCCIVTINDMTTTEGGELDDFGLMCSRLSSNSFTVDTMSNNCDTTIKAELSDLFNKLSLRLVEEDGDNPAKIYLGSIYDAAYNNIHTDGDTYTKVDLADTISALNKDLAVTGQSNIDSAYTTPAGEGSDDYSGTPGFALATYSLAITAQLTARNIGAAMYKSGMDSLCTSLSIPANDISLHHVALLDMADTTYLDQRNSMTSSLSSFFEGVTTGSYLVMSFEVETAGLGYSSTLLPTALYLTAIANLNNGTISLVYNNLTETQLEVLASLSQGSAESLNAATAGAEMSTYIRDIELLSWSYDGYNGSIKFGDVLDANAGNVIADIGTDGMISGIYNINYTESVVPI